MHFEERAYGGKVFRPRPEIAMESDGNLFLAGTPWGSRSSTAKALHLIRDQFLSARGDDEVTSPFDRLTCLSPMANDLRIAVKLANDSMYNEDNKNEYVSGFELLAMAYDGHELAWLQVGLPGIFLDRPGSPLLPLGPVFDLSTELSTNIATALTPLPHRLLGADPTSDYEVLSMRPQKGESLVMIARSFLPSDFYTLSAHERDIQNISRVLAQDNADTPFWVGRLSF